jgi:hypothetical protein
MFALLRTVHRWTDLFAVTHIAHIRREISGFANNVFDGILYHYLDIISNHVKQQLRLFILLAWIYMNGTYIYGRMD